MKTEIEWKIGEVWIQHLDFFWKQILLHDLEKFPTWVQDSCSRLSAEFSRLIFQNFTSIGIGEKMEDLGEKIKTHVSKISMGSRARN